MNPTPENSELESVMFRWLKYSFWLLVLSVAVSILTKTRWQLQSIYVAAPLLCLGMTSLLMAVRNKLKHHGNPFSDAARHIYTLLLLWSAITILRGLGLDYRSWRDSWGIIYYAWAWLVPACMVLGADISVWRLLLRTIYQQGVLGFAILILGSVLLNLNTPMNFTWGCTAALLFWHHIPKKWRKIILIGAFINLLLSVLAATRNQVLANVMLMLFAGYIQFFRKHSYRLVTQSSIILALSLVVASVMYAATTDYIPFLSRGVNAKIAYFEEKLPRNTRVTQKHSLYQAFIGDIRGVDFIIGRGSRGRYYYPGLRKMRDIIEWGYLFVILKGGLIMLILILSLALPAVYFGLFRTNNLFSKGCAFLVLGWLVEMVPFGLPSATMKYVMVWLAIGCCWSRAMRSRPDSDFMIPDTGA